MKSSNSKVYGPFIFGLMLATIHLLWLFVVYLGYGKIVLDFIFDIHMLNMSYTIQDFNYLNASALLIISFLGGVFLGYIYNFLISEFNETDIQEN